MIAIRTKASWHEIWWLEKLFEGREPVNPLSRSIDQGNLKGFRELSSVIAADRLAIKPHFPIATGAMAKFSSFWSPGQRPAPSPVFSGRLSCADSKGDPLRTTSGGPQGPLPSTSHRPSNALPRATEERPCSSPSISPEASSWILPGPCVECQDCPFRQVTGHLSARHWLTVDVPVDQKSSCGSVAMSSCLWLVRCGIDMAESPW
jgi:hypothetical protein